MKKVQVSKKAPKTILVTRKTPKPARPSVPYKKARYTA